jgi:hypothetical protein
MDEVQQLVETIRQATWQIRDVEAELKPVIENAKARLAELLTKGNYVDSEGYARLIPPSVRITYDYKALDYLLGNDPAGQYQWLRAYRKETPVKGGVTVK